MRAEIPTIMYLCMLQCGTMRVRGIQNEVDMQPKEIFIIARQHQCYRSSDSHCRSGLPHVLEDQLLQLKPPFVSAPSHVFVSRHQPQAIVSVHVSHFSNCRQKKSLAVPRILALTSHTVAAAKIKIAIRIIQCFLVNQHKTSQTKAKIACKHPKS